MKNFILRLLRNIPLLFLSVIIAASVWAFATVSGDPTEEGRFTQGVSVEVIGLADNYIVTSNLPNTININLLAPNSVWRRMSLERTTAEAVIDVTGLEPGTYELPIDIQIGISPVKVTFFSPSTVEVTIEKTETRNYPIEVVETGEISTAYRAEPAKLSSDTVDITGTVSLLDSIDRVYVTLDRNNNTESINANLPVMAANADGVTVKNISIKPDKVNVTEEIKIRGGYRILSVKLAVSGEIAQGYRVDELSVVPSFVTVYSSDKEVLNSLDSYIDTETVRLSEINSSTSEKIGLMVPEGVTIVGDPTVTMNVTVTAVEGTSAFSNLPVTILGLEEGYEAVISPTEIDAYLVGPVNTLKAITNANITVTVALQDLEPGSYSLEPKIEVSSSEPLSVQSIMPATIAVEIKPAEAQTLTENEDTEESHD